MTCLPVGEAGPLLYVMRIPHVTKVAVKPVSARTYYELGNSSTMSWEILVPISHTVLSSKFAAGDVLALYLAGEASPQS